MPEKRPRGEKGGGPSYLNETRRAALSITVILPLVMLYQIGIVHSGFAARNLAELWMVQALARLGVPAVALINALAVAALLYALWRLVQTGPICLTFIAGMLLESTVYAVLIFKAVASASSVVQKQVESFLILEDVPWPSLWLSVGAGVYEELLFRLLLVGGGVLVFRKVFLWNDFWSHVVVLLVSSLLFSAAHHASAVGEQFSTFVFVFRTLCGVGLGVIFLTRGIGIAVWSHALYNVLVLWAGFQSGPGAP